MIQVAMRTYNTVKKTSSRTSALLDDLRPRHGSNA
jgi:hypothetical protein